MIFILYLVQCSLGTFIHFVKPAVFVGRPPQNYLHAVVGLLIIGLALFQVRTGYKQQWPDSTGFGDLPKGVNYLWYAWVVVSISPSCTSMITDDAFAAYLLPVLYVGGLSLLRRQHRQEVRSPIANPIPSTPPISPIANSISSTTPIASIANSDSSTTPILWSDLKQAVAMVVEALESMQVQFGICGGAAIALILDQNNDQFRITRDIDLIVQPDSSRNIDAEYVSVRLLQKYPSKFEAVDCYGVKVSAARITRDDGTQILVEVEMFDIQAWPDRKQYDLNKAQNSRVQVPIGEKTAYVLSPVWLLRDKIITQHKRAGSQKEKTDLQDVRSLVGYVDRRALVMKSEEEIEALQALLTKRPEWTESLEGAIECPEVFGN